MTKIKKVHCLFEQSGAFKRAFIKRGIFPCTYFSQSSFINHKFIFGEKYEKDYEYELF